MVNIVIADDLTVLGLLKYSSKFPTFTLIVWIPFAKQMTPFEMTESGIIFYMRPAYERRRYNVTSPLNGWAHIQKSLPNKLTACHKCWALRTNCSPANRCIPVHWLIIWRRLSPPLPRYLTLPSCDQFAAVNKQQQAKLIHYIDNNSVVWWKKLKSSDILFFILWVLLTLKCCQM